MARLRDTAFGRRWTFKWQLALRGGPTPESGVTATPLQDGKRVIWAGFKTETALFPILQSIADGGFEGWSNNGRTKDWKDWGGTGHGYEGFLSDNYYVLLAVLDREMALSGRADRFHSAAGSAP